MSDGQQLINIFSDLLKVIDRVDKKIKETNFIFDTHLKLSKLSNEISKQLIFLARDGDRVIEEVNTISTVIATFQTLLATTCTGHTFTQRGTEDFSKHLSEMDNQIKVITAILLRLNKNQVDITPREKLKIWGFSVESYPEQTAFLVTKIKDCSLINDKCGRKSPSFFKETLPIVIKYNMLTEIYWAGIVLTVKELDAYAPDHISDFVEKGCMLHLVNEQTWDELINLVETDGELNIDLEALAKEDFTKSDFWAFLTKYVMAIAKKHRVNTWYLFQNQCIPALIKYNLLTPQNYESVVDNLIVLAKICRTATPYLFGEIFERIIHSGLLTNETWSHFLNLFKKEIRSSKSKIHMLIHYGTIRDEHRPLAEYVLLYQPKQFLKIVKFLGNVSILDLNVDGTLNYITAFSRPLILESKNPAYILRMLMPIGESPLEKRYTFLCRYANKNSELIRLKNIISRIVSFLGKTNANLTDKGYLMLLENISALFTPLLLSFTEKKQELAILTKVKEDFELEKLDTNLVNDLFIESYKLFKGAEYNAVIAKELLKQYLQKNTYPFVSYLNAYPYNVGDNVLWCRSFFQEKSKYWFAENKKTINLSEADLKVGVSQKTENFKSVAIQICESAGIRFSVVPSVEEISRIYVSAKREKTFDEDTLSNLKLQLDGIKSALGSKTMEVVKKITIYRELHPLKILMMGNWVKGSCLSAYSTVDHSWSTFANAVDANKAVFYIESDKKIIARVLVAITSKKNLIRFPLYYNIHTLDLDGPVNTYLRELAKKCGLTTIEGKATDVSNIRCENWYSDPVVKID